MHRVTLFVEDFGHEVFLTALLDRLAEVHRIEIEIKPRSIRGGRGKALKELKQFVRDLQGNREEVPDLLVVGVDANCKGHMECRREIDEAIQEFKYIAVAAVPEPHIERWLLIDSAAFKTVLGKGCSAPDHKCERDRFKELLRSAVREAGISPLLGGMEYAEDIVRAMDLQRMEQMEPSLGKVIRELNAKFKEWGQE
jgi:hypothetical protein